ncbi:bacteriohemerythrin [uncultured Propionivibrio sp.]|uniref:bacteriohemerythrin n=1 Tax=uncultured Propionivibrio sp. TaxID=426737 RepID=UPI0029C0A59D|nr:bacteriohemerythrin [uncultured Propionivibrio sp.]
MFAKMKLSARMYLPALLGAAGLILIYVFALMALRHCIVEGKKDKIKNLVEYAHTQFEYYDGLAKSGALTLEEAQTQAKESLRKARFDKTEYFWLNDLQPRNIMHPIRPQLEGKDQSDNKDPSGKPIYLEFVKAAKAGTGFVDYVGIKPETKVPEAKVSYVKLFEPWGWVIGTGVYVDDMNADFKGEAIRLGIVVFVTTLILIVVGRLVRRSIVDEFGGEPRDAMRIARQMAQGDLTGEFILQPGDRSSLLFVLSQMQANLRELLQAIEKNTLDVRGSLETLSSEANQINMATQLQSSVVKGTRDGVLELSSSVTTVTSLANETEVGSQEVARRSKEGAALAGKVSSEMQSIAAMVRQSSEQVLHLVERMQEISKMSIVIKEIADQTNLLALNAAIEAARAGEQGRGFAVVADEVRKLAERTTASTVEISQVMQTIETETALAVKGMNDAAPVIASGVEQSDVAARTLQDIEAYAMASLDKMQQLVASTDTQARRISEIVEQMDHVSQSTSQADEAIRQSHETSRVLERDANELFQMTRRFKLGEHAVGAARRQNTSVKPLIEWSPALAVGYAEIDTQHQRLVEIANELNSAMHSGAGAEASGRVLNELVDYTVQHFGYEEGEMRKHRYPQSDAHKEAHRKLVEEVSAFKEKFDSGKAAISIELMAFIRDWLLNHILKVDKELAGYLSRRTGG